MGNAVELTKVSKRYDNVRSLSDISMEIAQGETVTVLGPNGSGKSTLLRLVSLQSTPSSGTIRLFGEYPPRSDMKRKIGYLAHECFLYGELTVLENLQFYNKIMSLNGGSKEDALQEVVDALKIGRWLHSKARNLSHGSRKRADIARALLHRPELLVLDEPFSGLDPQARTLLVDYLKNSDQNRTVLLSSQDIELTREFCDREIALQYGKIERQSRCR